ncbi:CobW family GTP-binding protein [Salinarimonas rosea]|uniref:CobW family GTP-binding protein n=1 Tax=Salinarimonas rosea TaxID=552063 RepID=UPI0004104D04|nr:GTP-binding protein [Salinarimonas rosea]
MATIPLFLLTGFLGSGKSTLLSALVRHRGFADTAVIVNEFGEVGLDHLLVSEGDETNAVLLDSGCICCTLTSSLEDTLEALYYKAERGEIPRFARVVVETTGLADPGPIANALAAGPFVSRFVHLAAIVTTIDCVNGAEQLARFEEARLQAAMADRVILTKGDVATPDQRAATEAALAVLAPHVERLSAVSGDIDPALVLGAAEPGRRSPSPAEAGCDHDHHHDHDHDHDHDHHHEGHIHAHGYVSVAAPIDGPATWAGYARMVERARALGDDLLRVKGLIGFDDGGVYALQGVRLVFDPPRRLSWTPPEGTRDRLVVIARGIAPERLREIAGALAERE